MNTNQNEVKAKSTVQEMMVSRQAQEIQGAMVVAKRFPRDEDESFNRIINACQRVELAEQATYEYPRGGTKVYGPSIRLAEALARQWGNIDYGVIELEQTDGKSEMMAYAWDLETNARATRIFSVEHKRDTKSGSKKLTSVRDIYELTANMGARRMRACILQVIPGYITDAAVKQCETTVKGNQTMPLEERIKEMIKTFKEEYGVSKKQLEKFIGSNAEAFSENNMRRLKIVYMSLKDGMAGVEDFFGNEEDIQSPFTKKEESADDEDFGKDVKEALEADEDAETN